MNNTRTEFCILVKLKSLMKMCLHETHNRAWAGEHFSDVLLIKNDLKHGDALSPLAFNFALEYTIRKAQARQERLILNGTHQFLVCADDVNILGGSIHTAKKSTKGLVVTSKEFGVEVNVENTKYIPFSHEENAGKYHNVKIDNKFLVSMEQFKYLGTKLTNRSCIHEEINVKLKSGDTCYLSVQNVLTSSLLSKNINIKILRPVILSIVLMGVRLGLLH